MQKTVFFRNCLGVFQGGGCRAAAFAGAYEEAVKRGVSFSEVAGASAGSVIAALIGAGASPTFISEKLLHFRKAVGIEVYGFAHAARAKCFPERLH